MKKAIFVVLDGADGTGKDTQALQLVAAAKERGLAVAHFAFPDYTTLVGHDIKAYQSGQFGEMDAIHPRVISYLYAVNRYELNKALSKALQTQDIVIAARYVSSNVVYSSVRVPEGERPDFQRWVEQLDHDVLDNPREDAVVCLDLPLELSDQLIAKRNLGRRDINDENRAYRQSVRNEYRRLAAERANWHLIDCTENSQIRSIASIGDEISRLVFDTLLPEHLHDVGK